MSEPLLNVMKIMLLAGLYLFFVRVLWSVFNELRDPRSVVRPDKVRKSKSRAKPGPDAAHDATVRRSAPIVPSGIPPSFEPVPSGAGGALGTAAPLATGRLTVIEPAEIAGYHYSLGPEITLGRAATNGIVLDDTYVSTVHARIFATNGTFFIEDLASRNGSVLNGEPLVATTALMPGDRVQVGATVMEFG